MSTLPFLIDSSGRKIPLGGQLASGGEGTVFTLANNSALVAKVYHRPPSSQTIDKLLTMVRLANPGLIKIAAWPSDLLYHARTGQLAGFVMPRLTKYRPIQQLYNPVQRMRYFPQCGWNFQVRTAINLAAAFDEVHRADCLVGDVNESNIQVGNLALVRLIDCDSFQVQANGKAYLCEVGVAHYTPPELQGKTLRGLVRTENHDRFGLAVLIYQLLHVGRHPYAGIYRGNGDPSFEELISEYRFSQGPLAHTWGMAPPPHTPTFADIPPELGNLFRKAFERGSQSGGRPRAFEWLTPLQRLEGSIVECFTDPGHQYWRGTKTCVWCRLANHNGPEYYFGASEKLEKFVVDEVKLQEVLRRLNACRPFKFAYDRRRFSPARSPGPAPLPIGLEEHRSSLKIQGVALGLSLIVLFFGRIHEAIGISAFLCTVIFGIWLVIHLLRSPWWREYQARITTRNSAWDKLTKFEENWNQIVKRYEWDHAESSRLLQLSISACIALASQYNHELLRLESMAEEIARTRHLLFFPIPEDIPQIGANRKRILASHGITTAADINQSRLRQIKGFGEVLTGNLLEWKQNIIRQFRFDRTNALSGAEQRGVTTNYRNLQLKKLDEINKQIGHIEALIPTCQAALQKLIPDLKQAIFSYEKAEAGVQLLKGKR